MPQSLRMLELSQLAENGEYYKDCAIKILSAITENYSNLENENQALLRGATANKAGEENVEVVLIYADYYYVEAVRGLYPDKYDLPWE